MAKQQIKTNISDINLPEDLVKFLTDKQVDLLKCYLADYNFLEMAKTVGKTFRKRADLIDSLIDLGKALCAYKLLECDISPNIFNEAKPKAYLKGFNDCKKEIWRLIQDDKKYRR